LIARSVIDQALNGNRQAVREIADRTEGRPSAAVEITSPSQSQCVEMLTDEQLKEIILEEVMRRKAGASEK
jgi:hypothetical protein